MSFTKSVTQEKSLIFLHIPSTAGVTLSWIIRRQFPQNATIGMNIESDPECIDEFKHLPEKRRAEIRYLGGHIPFGLHEYLPCPSTYITILREPVDRVISHYYHVLRTPRHPFYDESKNMSLQDYVSSGIFSDLSNGQTRWISGVTEVGVLPTSRPLPTETLEIAKRNLQEHFTVVMLTERFDESLILLKRALGWRTRNILYTKHHVGRNRPPKDEIASDTLKLIERYNELDIQLYEFAKQMFEERISQQDSSFRRDLQTFELCNKVYSAPEKLHRGLLRWADSVPYLRDIKRSVAKRLYHI